MSNTPQKPQVIILCEDTTHFHFVRGVLLLSGWQDKQIRGNISPLGSAEQWVRNNYKKELLAYRARKNKRNVALIVITDADKKSVQDRIDDLHKTVLPGPQKLDSRLAGERVAIAVPDRNIESWFHFLETGDFDPAEVKTDFKKKYKEAKPTKKSRELLDLCEEGLAPPVLPPSLEHACREWGVFRSRCP